MSTLLQRLNGTVIVSVLVLVIFAAVIALALSRTLPDTTAVTGLVSTISTLATAVVTYWVGSSAGSAAKDDERRQAAAAAQQQKVTTP